MKASTYFIADANSLLMELDDAEKAEIYNNLPSGQFTKGKTEYHNRHEKLLDNLHNHK